MAFTKRRRRIYQGGLHGCLVWRQNLHKNQAQLSEKRSFSKHGRRVGPKMAFFFYRTLNLLRTISPKFKSRQNFSKYEGVSAILLRRSLRSAFSLLFPSKLALFSVVFCPVRRSKGVASVQNAQAPNGKTIIEEWRLFIWNLTACLVNSIQLLEQMWRLRLCPLSNCAVVPTAAVNLDFDSVIIREMWQKISLDV